MKQVVQITPGAAFQLKHTFLVYKSLSALKAIPRSQTDNAPESEDQINPSNRGEFMKPKVKMRYNQIYWNENVQYHLVENFKLNRSTWKLGTKENSGCCDKGLVSQVPDCNRSTSLWENNRSEKLLSDRRQKREKDTRKSIIVRNESIGRSHIRHLNVFLQIFLGNELVRRYFWFFLSANYWGILSIMMTCRIHT